VIDDALDAGLYAALAASFPRWQSIVGGERTQNNRNYRVAAQAIVSDPRFAAVWRELAAFHTSNAFFRQVVALFGDAIRALALFGQKGLTTFENLRGKSVATTSVGAFGEIAMRKTAKERGMEIGKDIKLLYHKGPADAFSTFLVGNADGLIVTPPQTEMARSKGFPVIIDYYEKGLKIIGPGTGVARAFVQKNPNTLKIFLMGYLDGVKRSLDDPAYAKNVLAQSSKITDQKLVEDSYQEGVKVWNKDMTVDPEPIKLVLEQSTVPKASGLDPKRFYDNSLIREVNRDYASKLFPGEVR